jgi:hypothetical protein
MDWTLKTFLRCYVTEGVTVPHISAKYDKSYRESTEDSRRPDKATPEYLYSGRESNHSRAALNQQLGCNANDRSRGSLNKIRLTKEGGGGRDGGSFGCCAKLVCADSEVTAREERCVATKHALLYWQSTVAASWRVVTTPSVAATQTQDTRGLQDSYGQSRVLASVFQN